MRSSYAFLLKISHIRGILTHSEISNNSFKSNY